MTKKFEDADNELKPLAEELLEDENFADGAKIRYLFKLGDGGNFLGKCMLATGPWEFLVDYDYVILIKKNFWEKASNTQKKALLYHELKHIGKKEKRDGTMKWGIVEHDVELFVDVIHKYGCWTDGLGILKNVIKDKKMEGE